MRAARARWSEYRALVMDVQRCMLDVMCASVRERGTVRFRLANAGRATQNIVLEGSPDYSTEAAAALRVACMPLFTRTRAHSNWQHAIIPYLRGVEWEIAPAGAGFTWLELLIDFELATGARVVQTTRAMHTHAAAPHNQSVEAVLHAFVGAVHGVVRDAVHCDAFAFFDPPPRGEPENRPRAIGLKAAGPTMRGRPAVPPERREELARVLRLLRSKRPPRGPLMAVASAASKCAARAWGGPRRGGKGMGQGTARGRSHDRPTLSGAPGMGNTRLCCSTNLQSLCMDGLMLGA